MSTTCIAWSDEESKCGEDLVCIGDEDRVGVEVKMLVKLLYLSIPTLRGRGREADKLH